MTEQQTAPKAWYLADVIAELPNTRPTRAWYDLGSQVYIRLDDAGDVVVFSGNPRRGAWHLPAAVCQACLRTVRTPDGKPMPLPVTQRRFLDTQYVASLYQ